MRSTDFFALPRSLQERFIAATAGAGLPRPILATPASRQLPIGWASACIVGVLGLLAALGHGFGRLDSLHAIASWRTIGLYATLLAVVGGSCLGLVQALGRARRLPYRPGLYLFPIGVIQARRSELRVYPWNELEQTGFCRQGRELRLEFGPGAAFGFALSDPEQRGRVEAEIKSAQERLKQAQASARPRELGNLDPLTDNGVPNPLLPATPLVRQETWWSRGWWWVGPLLGVVLAWPVWSVRNYFAGRALLAAARAAHSPAAYRAYLAAAGPNDEVSRMLLPRAELAVAERSGSVQAVETVLKRYPDARIRPEFEQALRKALLGELARVRAAKTPDALRRFRSEQPHHALVAAEIDAALHGLYQAGLANYRAGGLPRRPDLVAFFGRLLDYAERQGPSVELRFLGKLDRSVESADQRVSTSPYSDGPTSLPSQYFSGPHALERERRTAETLGRRFAQTFPGGLLTFDQSAGPTAEAADANLKVPTLIVEHTTIMNGTYANGHPPRILVGVGILFSATWRVPGDPSPVRFKFSFWHAPDRSQLRDRELGPERYYLQVADEAFTQFSAKYLASIFKDAQLPGG